MVVKKDEKERKEEDLNGITYLTIRNTIRYPENLRQMNKIRKKKEEKFTH